MVKIMIILILFTAMIFATNFSFNRNYVDNNYGGNGAPGFVRSGDMDGDTDIDLVAGGGRALFVYENDGNPNKANWTRYGNLDGTGNMGLNGACLYDVDGDDDLDVVGAKYYDDLGWWENPGSLGNTAWAWHKIADETYYMHCLMRADLDRDGEAGEFVANLISGSNIRVKWYTPGADPKQVWQVHTIESGRNHGSNNHAGLDTGDVDKDGHVDIGYSNGWYEAPDNPTGTWTWHQATTKGGISNVALRDLDNDGDLDLITASGHHSTGVFWHECPATPTNSWTQRTIDVGIVNPEGLACLDLDCDGDLDVIACDLNFNSWDQEVHHVYVFENTGTVSAPSWNKQDISGGSYASHKLQVDDINKDGKIDIISEGCGYKYISYYENQTAGICESVAIIPNPENLDRKDFSVTNPVTSNMIRFHGPPTHYNGTSIMIFDMQGNSTGSIYIMNSSSSRSGIRLPENMPSGNYLLNISTEDGWNFNRKFVLIR
jgi:hypothetical protein